MQGLRQDSHLSAKHILRGAEANFTRFRRPLESTRRDDLREWVAMLFWCLHPIKREFMEHDAAEGATVRGRVPPDANKLEQRTATHVRINNSKDAARGDHDFDEVQGQV